MTHAKMLPVLATLNGTGSPPQPTTKGASASQGPGHGATAVGPPPETRQ